MSSNSDDDKDLCLRSTFNARKTAKFSYSFSHLILTTTLDAGLEEMQDREVR